MRNFDWDCCYWVSPWADLLHWKLEVSLLVLFWFSFHFLQTSWAEDWTIAAPLWRQGWWIQFYLECWYLGWKVPKIRLLFAEHQDSSVHYTDGTTFALHLSGNRIWWLILRVHSTSWLWLWHCSWSWWSVYWWLRIFCGDLSLILWAAMKIMRQCSCLRRWGCQSHEGAADLCII